MPDCHSAERWLIGNCDGDDVAFITTQTECEEAAANLEKADTTAFVTNQKESRPYGCYYKASSNQLYFNPEGDPISKDLDRRSLCRRTTPVNWNYNIANTLIPLEVTKIQAVLRADADFQLKYSLNPNLEFSSTFGPYTLVPQTKLLSRTFWIPVGGGLAIPFNVQVDMSLHASLKLALSAKLPEPVSVAVRAQGTLRYGGVWYSAAHPTKTENTFESIKGPETVAFSYDYPDVAQTLMDVEIKGEAKLILTPTIFIRLQAMVPLEFQLNFWGHGMSQRAKLSLVCVCAAGGLEFLKYGAMTDASQRSCRKCPGTAADLYWGITSRPVHAL